MKGTRRASSSRGSKAAPEVVNLLDDEEDEDAVVDDAVAMKAAAARRSAATGAAPTAAAGGKRKASGCDHSYEFPADDSDAGIDSEEEQEQAAKKQRRRQQPSATQAKRSNSSRARGAGAAASSGRRTKVSSTTTRKASSSAGPGNAAAAKQLTLQAKAFGALFLSSSQPAAAAAGGSQDAAAAAPKPAPLSPSAPSAAAARAASPDGFIQWVDKHEPSSPAELVVHKRKVAEVQTWLQAYLDSGRAGKATSVLLITGPTGCGKSAVLRVLAASLGFELLEWTAPVPTLWGDYQYQAGAGVGYSSKLDEFDMFVTRCKFAALPLSSSSSKQGHLLQPQSQSQQQLSQQPTLQQQKQQQPTSQQQHTQQHQHASRQHTQQPTSQQQQRQQPRMKLLLVDDLPYVGDAVRRGRLAAALQDLTATARCPVVVVATTEEGSSGGSRAGGGGGGYGGYGAAQAGMTTKGLHKDLLAVLERAGASSITFNPITANVITKALQVIADKEGFTLNPDTAEGIAQAAAGDMRNAIQSLQLLLMQQEAAAQPANKKGKAKAPRRPRKPAAKDPAAVAAAEAAKQKVASQVARDTHLSVFHAVGKLLHYKRQQPEQQDQEQDGASTQQQQQQQPAPGAAAADDGDHGVSLMDADGGAAAAEANGALQQLHLLPRFQRPRLRINPEHICQGSGLEALQVTAFLSENYTHFMSEDAIEQAAEAAGHFSDAGYLACYRSTTASSSSFWDEDDPSSNTMQAAAATSVAARGLLFSNNHPAPPRWLPLKGPSCFLPDKAATGNLQKLGEAVQQLQDIWQNAGPAEQQAVMAMAGQLLHVGRQERAAQVLPFMQVLCRQQSHAWLHQLLPRSWYSVWNGTVSERQSAAVQGPYTQAMMQAAVAAVVAASGSAKQGAENVGQGSGATGDGDVQWDDEIESISE